MNYIELIKIYIHWCEKSDLKKFLNRRIPQLITYKVRNIDFRKKKKSGAVNNSQLKSGFLFQRHACEHETQTGREPINEDNLFTKIYIEKKKVMPDF